eukprot:91145-Chlamydomonas_euryale.AAC.4
MQRIVHGQAHAPVTAPLACNNGACASTCAGDGATRIKRMAHAQAHAPVTAPLACNEWHMRKHTRR